MNFTTQARQLLDGQDPVEVVARLLAVIETATQETQASTDRLHALADMVEHTLADIDHDTWQRQAIRRQLANGPSTLTVKAPGPTLPVKH